MNMNKDCTPEELYRTHNHDIDESEKYPYLSFYGKSVLQIAKEKDIPEKNLILLEKAVSIIVKSEEDGISSRFYDGKKENKLLQFAASWFRGDFGRSSAYLNSYDFIDYTSNFLEHQSSGELTILEKSLKRKVWSKNVTGTDTGYKDIHGNSICVGDIVKEGCTGLVKEVVWNQKKASYWLNGCGEGYGIEDSDVEWEIVQPISQIGCIYPELDFNEIDYE